MMIKGGIKALGIVRDDEDDDDDVVASHGPSLTVTTTTAISQRHAVGSAC
jgi:hypothetical protein